MASQNDATMQEQFAMMQKQMQKQMEQLTQATATFTNLLQGGGFLPMVGGSAPAPPMAMVFAHPYSGTDATMANHVAYGLPPVKSELPKAVHEAVPEAAPEAVPEDAPEAVGEAVGEGFLSYDSGSESEAGSDASYDSDEDDSNGSSGESAPTFQVSTAVLPTLRESIDILEEAGLSVDTKDTKSGTMYWVEKVRIERTWFLRMLAVMCASKGKRATLSYRGQFNFEFDGHGIVSVDTHSFSHLFGYSPHLPGDTQVIIGESSRSDAWFSCQAVSQDGSLYDLPEHEARPKVKSLSGTVVRLTANVSGQRVTTQAIQKDSGDWLPVAVHPRSVGKRITVFEVPNTSEHCTAVFKSAFGSTIGVPPKSA